ncbi:MAG: hypothetical protein AAF968_27610, partial [Pseudomonadota bacterium]
MQQMLPFLRVRFIAAAMIILVPVAGVVGVTTTVNAYYQAQQRYAITLTKLSHAVTQLALEVTEFQATKGTSKQRAEIRETFTHTLSLYTALRFVDPEGGDAASRGAGVEGAATLYTLHDELRLDPAKLKERYNFNNFEMSAELERIWESVPADGDMEGASLQAIIGQLLVTIAPATQRAGALQAEDWTWIARFEREWA